MVRLALPSFVVFFFFNTSSVALPYQNVLKTLKPVIDCGNTTENPPILDWPSNTKTPPKPAKITTVKDRAFYDKLGQQHFFRGVNVVFKGFPWYPNATEWHPQYSFNDQDIDLLADLNINVIRLGVMWPGVEPSKGQYNYTYINILKNIVEKCNNKGIYVLLDMHQDILSPRFCGEGVPDWVLAPPRRIFGFPYPVSKPFPLKDSTPSEENCQKFDWPKYHFSLELSENFQNLYDNFNGVGDAFADFWKLVAQEFKDYENVIGYDLINEPWAGNIFKMPILLSPGVADKVNLQSFYDKIAASIRSVDPEGLIFFESVTWDNLVVGFTSVPGGSSYQEKSVLSYHHYQPKPNLLPLDRTIEERSADAIRLNSGLFLTEFDIAYYPDDGVKNLIANLEILDRYMQSWIGWEYKPFNPLTGYGDSLFNPCTGEIRSEMVLAYSRPYVHQVQGKLIYQKFDMESKTLELKYSPNSQEGITEIRIQKRLYYPIGFIVSFIPDGITYTLPPNDENRIQIVIDPATAMEFDDGITVMLEPSSNEPYEL